MTVRIRFFARFRELLGTDIVVDAPKNKGLSDLVKDVAGKNQEGYDAIFDEKGAFREYVILMQNGKRVETSDAPAIRVAEGDEIAVFPPVAGG
ncbi:ubiquitin-like small modifier protein 1 [Methanoregula sp.]|jgi:molybdopterin synthase sulfur carrier subunit|uniref:ubiquitin-like small modifier protein 1 n=1 Tax=Methanoregula sp. TaxID=2052170 RepID=UPI0025E022B6|nr:ubiquitin-like small modifier protein 1 [Methanoregula sp.]